MVEKKISKVFMVITIILFFNPLYVHSINEATDNGLTMGEEAQSYVEKGTNFFMEGKYQDALSSYREAKRISPEFLPAYYNEALVLKELKKYSEALEVFQGIIKTNPNSISVNYQIGDILEKMNKQVEAKEWFEKAAALSPKSAMAYYNRANTLQKLGKVEEAKSDYIKAYQLDQNFEFQPDAISQNNTVQEAEAVDNELEENNAKSLNASIFGRMDGFVEQYIPEEYNRYIIYAILLTIPINVILIVLNYRNKKKNATIEKKIIEYIQQQLGVYTFAEEDEMENEEQKYPKTKELLGSWSTSKLENTLNRIKKDYHNIYSYEPLIDICILLDDELNSRDKTSKEELNDIFLR